MKERYVYDLGNGPKEYEVDAIAKRLYLDKDYLQQVLDYENDEINSAIAKSTKEKVLGEKLDFLRKNFSSIFIMEHGPKAILADYFSMSSRKKSFLKTLEDSLEKEQSGYISLSSDTLNLLAVNTVSNYDKDNYSLYHVCDFESLKGVAEGSLSREELIKYNNILGGPLTKMEFDLSEMTSSLVLSIENAKNLVSFVKEHRLPIVYNEVIFQTVCEEKKAGKCYVAFLNSQK